MGCSIQSSLEISGWTIVLQTDLPRGRWLPGNVVGNFSGKDEQICQVNVQCGQETNSIGQPQTVKD